MARGIPTIGVNQFNPDFVALARAYACRTATPQSFEEFESGLQNACAADRPTLIEMREVAVFLQ